MKTIDAHAHTFIPAVVDAVRGTELEKGAAASAAGNLVMRSERLQRMDEQGIDMEVLTINPWWYSADRAVSERLIEVQNRGLAQLVAAQPERFTALATVAMQHPELAAEQLRDAFKTHRMRGVSLGCTVGSDELANKRFDPFWKAAEDLQALIFIHPAGVPELRGRLQGNGFLANVAGGATSNVLGTVQPVADVGRIARERLREERVELRPEIGGRLGGEGDRVGADLDDEVAGLGR